MLVRRNERSTPGVEEVVEGVHCRTPKEVYKNLEAGYYVDRLGQLVRLGLRLLAHDLSKSAFQAEKELAELLLDVVEDSTPDNNRIKELLLSNQKAWRQFFEVMAEYRDGQPLDHEETQPSQFWEGTSEFTLPNRSKESRIDFTPISINRRLWFKSPIVEWALVFVDLLAGDDSEQVTKINKIKALVIKTEEERRKQIENNRIKRELQQKWEEFKSDFNPEDIASVFELKHQLEQVDPPLRLNLFMSVLLSYPGVADEYLSKNENALSQMIQGATQDGVIIIDYWLLSGVAKSAFHSDIHTQIVEELITPDNVTRIDRVGWALEKLVEEGGKAGREFVRSLITMGNITEIEGVAGVLKMFIKTGDGDGRQFVMQLINQDNVVNIERGVEVLEMLVEEGGLIELVFVDRIINNDEVCYKIKEKNHVGLEFLLHELRRKKETKKARLFFKIINRLNK